MKVLLATFVVALFIGMSNGIKGLCYRYIRKENCKNEKGVQQMIDKNLLRLHGDNKKDI